MIYNRTLEAGDDFSIEDLGSDSGIVFFFFSLFIFTEKIV